MKKIVLLCCLVLGTNIGLQGAKRPGWVDSIPVKPYLYQGIGVADDTGSKEDDRLRADQNARTEIIQEISTTIRSELSSFYSEANANGEPGDDQSFEVFTSLSSAYAEATIEGIQIVDRYFDKKAKVYYSYATLERSAFQAQMAQKADEARNLARERFRYARESLTAGIISETLEQLSQALSHVMLAQSIVKKQLQGDLDGDGQVEFLDAAISQELGKIVHNIRIVKLSGDGQKGERNQGLPAPLTGQVLYVDEAGGTRPIANLPLGVLVEGAETDYSPQINSDPSGQFSIRINNIQSASIANPSVGVSLYLPHMQILAEQSGQSVEDIFSNTVKYEFRMDVASAVKIFVRVLEEINGEAIPRPKSDGTLIKALLAKKYKVIGARQLASKISIDDLDQYVGYEALDALTETLADMADYAIVGTIISETSSTGTLNYARASANLKAIDLSSGRIIATGQLENLKAAGNTEKKANTSALRKCSTAAIESLLIQLDKALN